MARLAAAGIAHRLDLDVEQADDLKLAVTEACGYLLAQDGKKASSNIEVEWSVGTDELTVQVRRAGVQTDASAAPGDEELASADTSGPTDAEIGLFLIHALMDTVAETEDGSGLLMTKAIRRTADE